jgi:hypothetical protein
MRPSVKPIFAQYSRSWTIGVVSSVHWFGPRMWTLVFILQSGGGIGSPQPPVLGGGVACGVGVGVGTGPGVGVGFGSGVGVGVGIVGIDTLRTPEVGALGAALGAVGSSSVIVWQPTRTRAAAIP